MTEALKDMLGVEDVWFWSHSRRVTEEFLRWATCVLDHRHVVIIVFTLLPALVPVQHLLE